MVAGLVDCAFGSLRGRGNPISKESSCSGASASLWGQAAPLNFCEGERPALALGSVLRYGMLVDMSSLRVCLYLLEPSGPLRYW